MTVKSTSERRGEDFGLAIFLGRRHGTDWKASAAANRGDMGDGMRAHRGGIGLKQGTGTILLHCSPEAVQEALVRTVCHLVMSSNSAPLHIRASKLQGQPFPFFAST